VCKTCGFVLAIRVIDETFEGKPVKTEGSSIGEGPVNRVGHTAYNHLYQDGGLGTMLMSENNKKMRM
jgi:hypothetical protein